MTTDEGAGGKIVLHVIEGDPNALLDRVWRRLGRKLRKRLSSIEVCTTDEFERTDAPLAVGQTQVAQALDLAHYEDMRSQAEEVLAERREYPPFLAQIGEVLHKSVVAAYVNTPTITERVASKVGVEVAEPKAEDPEAHQRVLIETEALLNAGHPSPNMVLSARVSPWRMSWLRRTGVSIWWDRNANRFVLVEGEPAHFEGVRVRL